MKKPTLKTTIKVKKTKPNLPRKKKPIKKVVPKKGRWAACCREIEALVKCNEDTFKIVKKDLRSYLIIKSVFTIEIRKNNNYVHQPYSQNVEAMQYKCFLVVDGLIDGLANGDDLTKEYMDFDIPIIHIAIPEEVKYKFSDYR